MSVTELGERMTAHELTVAWPEFFAYRQREAERQQQREEAQQSPRSFA